MIVLDTNVISELSKPVPSPAVLSWMDNHSPEDFFLTSVTVGEVMYGIGTLPQGKRRARLFELSASLFDDLFRGRILSFNSQSALEYAHLAVIRKHMGVPLHLADGEIAGICRACGASLATRNIKDFVHLGLDLIDPWSE